ncbi:protein O-glucosyltransferase 2-like isoform X7 [Dreissena polymorpha]|uniref:protein O-glucosyltransferase 2-like isoform X6 n=1 Tax=Dreissena polymorpha TaxID=45954 RepID=UPI002263F40B|nr:protein O-glucosyltransferase 2-like isoform X6 [Dreissena polymorpha]XP_052214099.1 protein O-glucosyltransferase 2-like isoform X7 [Dreissena polymorpha]
MSALQMWKCLKVLFLVLLCLNSSASESKGESGSVDWKKTKIWGPGLKAEFVVPARYFFVQLIDNEGNNFTKSAGERPFDVHLKNQDGGRVRVYLRVLDRTDGMYLVNYRIYETLADLEISLTKDNIHIGDSPFQLKGFVAHENCNCPEPRLSTWYKHMSCPASYRQIKNDLAIFKDVDLESTARETIQRFNISTAHSLSRYKIINNKIYRKTYGEHVGFKMFSDSILLSLTRKVVLPDIELFINLGDWPLEKKTVADNPVPIFSWCGSDTSRDIVMPTYDLTEASLELLGRQSLDIHHVMGKSPLPWEQKTEKGFWRGRDSRQERLDLVVMARAHPDLLDAKMTRMFFFKHDQEKYGDLVQNIPFFDFFKYKYQVTLDGTVAAYRFPYLLAGDGVVLKQDSSYYEHFYKDLQPYVHYIPFKHDLSDLLQQIQWARENDDKAREISKNAQDFAFHRLHPGEIFCYHVKLFEEYAKRLKSPPSAPDDTWEAVEQPKGQDSECACEKLRKKSRHAHVDDEL